LVQDGAGYDMVETTFWSGRMNIDMDLVILISVILVVAIIIVLDTTKDGKE